MITGQLVEMSEGEARSALLESYRGFLVRERGLAAESVRCYGNHARDFLRALPDPLVGSLAELSAGQVTDYVVVYCGGGRNVSSAKAMVTALRSLLRYLHLSGWIGTAMSGAVPAVAGWRLGSLPRGLEPGQVRRLLGASDLGRPAGVREHAIVVMLAGLGLRTAEVAALRLDDVDWRAGQVLIRGKGNRIERLPLPAPVGQALVSYLTGARPVTDCRSVFVPVRGEPRALTAGAVRRVVAQACARAGLPRLGAHRLRHTLATEMLAAGTPLTQIGQVLRHRSQLSTATYAKVDFQALRPLAQPWPGSQS